MGPNPPSFALREVWPPGTVVKDEYIIESRLGKGGFGTVYKARHRLLQSNHVIKRLHEEYSSDEDYVRKFVAEGQVIRRLKDCPYIVEVEHMTTTSDQHLILIMEYMPGGDLSALMSERPFLTVAEVTGYAVQIAEGLRAAHSIDLIHRDVKPQNVLLGSNKRRAKLADFGIAADHSNGMVPSVVRGGSIGYAAPEQWTMSGRQLDGRSDIYSLGVTMYQMLTGCMPYAAADIGSWIDAVRTAQPVPVNRLRDDVPPDLSELVMNLISVTREQRLPTADAVLERLRPYASAEDWNRSAALRVPPPQHNLLQQQGLPQQRPVPPASPPQQQQRPPTYSPTVYQQQAPQSYGQQFASAPTYAPPPSQPPQSPSYPAGPWATGGGIAPPYQPPLQMPQSPYMPPPPAQARGSRLWMIGAGLAAVALIGLAVWRFFPTAGEAETVLRLEGSTTIGDELGPALIRGFLDKERAADLKETPDELPNPAAPDQKWKRFTFHALLPDSNGTKAFVVLANGSGNAFKALKAGAAEIGMASRPVNSKEAAELSSLGDMTSAACENVLAVDGLAVVVHRSNGLQQITRSQIAAVFRGQISDWSQLGGAPGPVHLYGRNKESGTFDAFASLVLDGKKELMSRNVTVESSGDEIADKIGDDPGGIGYVGMAQVKSGVRALAVSDGPETTPLQPTPLTVATEDYILSRRLYLYTPAASKNWARRFVEFALSPEGQSIVKKIGYVEQTGEIVRDTAIPANAPAEYRDLVSGKGRMRFNLRFRSGSFDLDNKAQADIRRAFASLAERHIRSGLLLLGFADNRGSPDLNQRLSEQRALVVKHQFEQMGMDASIRGFSQAVPIGDNNTEQGRQRNRRVEVWVP